MVSPASPSRKKYLERGRSNLSRLGYRLEPAPRSQKPDGYFAASHAVRLKELSDAFASASSQAIFCSRGGYGSAALLEHLQTPRMKRVKIFCGSSDVTSIHIFLWQKLRWVTFLGPMVASGFEAGANATGGYDPESFARATTQTRSGWALPLRGETLARGAATGTLLGGCVSLLQTSLGTPWELDTRGAVLLLEDRGVKPYQLDRMLLHLRQAGKFKGVRGVVLGEFPQSEPPEGSEVTTAVVCRRILGPLGIPIVYGAPIGHTARPMLTVPLGVRVRLTATGEGRMDILEPAVTP